MRIVIPKPLPAQQQFWNSPARHKGFVGGIGSGKTLAGCVNILMQPAGTYGTVVAPTYPMLRDATLLTFLEKFRGCIRTYNISHGVMTLKNDTTIFWRSADNPQSLRGPNLNWFWLDEADYMDGEVWNVMLGRIRRHPTKAWVTTSPNGEDNWMYTEFYQKYLSGNKDYLHVTSRTQDNIHLPREYIDTLVDTYTSEHARQELGGEYIGKMSRVMDKDWIQYGIPPDEGMTYIAGVDLAISTKDDADDRAIVVVGKHTSGQLWVADVHYGKWSYQETKQKIKDVADAWQVAKVCVENVAFQDAMVQDLRAETMHIIEGVTPRGRDKLTRFLPIAGKYEHAHVKHSRTIDIAFTKQLLNFDGRGKQRDDMVDALIYAVNGHESNIYVYTL